MTQHKDRRANKIAFLSSSAGWGFDALTAHHAFTRLNNSITDWPDPAHTPTPRDLRRRVARERVRVVLPAWSKAGTPQLDSIWPNPATFLPLLPARPEKTRVPPSSHRIQPARAEANCGPARTEEDAEGKAVVRPVSPERRVHYPKIFSARSENRISDGPSRAASL